MKNDVYSNALLVALVILQIGDFVSTYILCKLKVTSEGNPIVATLMRWMGYKNALILAKGLGVVLVVYMYFHTPGIAILAMLTVAYVLVVCSNFAIYFKYR